MIDTHTKQIQCPEHPYDDHEATLFTYGSEWAGLWECPKTGASWVCKHTVTHFEDDETYPNEFGYSYTVKREICDNCECEIFKGAIIR